MYHATHSSIFLLLTSLSRNNHRRIYRIGKGRVEVERVTINQFSVPICSIFCALSAVLTLVVITKEDHHNPNLHHPLCTMVRQAELICTNNNLGSLLDDHGHPGSNRETCGPGNCEERFGGEKSRKLVEIGSGKSAEIEPDSESLRNHQAPNEGRQLWLRVADAGDSGWAPSETLPGATSDSTGSESSRKKSLEELQAHLLDLGWGNSHVAPREEAHHFIPKRSVLYRP